MEKEIKYLSGKIKELKALQTNTPIHAEEIRLLYNIMAVVVECNDKEG